MSHHSSHPEWFLSALVTLDQHCRGLMSDVLISSTEHLQVCASYLAMKPARVEERARVGEFLSRSDHSTILSAGYGDVPKGFRRALSRLGPKVQDQRCYSLLHETLLNAPSADVVECIHRLPSIDRQKLLIARMLSPSSLARANVVSAVAGMSAANSVSLAVDVSTAFQLLIERGVDREALTQAICRVRSERELMNLWSRWLVKADCPPHPVKDCVDVYTGISSGSALKGASVRFKNCAADRYMLGLVEGTEAFGEFQYNGSLVMVHLRQSDARWTFEGAFGPRNSHPNCKVRDALAQYLKAEGVAVPGQHHRESPWRAISRLSRAHLFDFEFE